MFFIKIAEPDYSRARVRKTYKRKMKHKLPRSNGTVYRMAKGLWDHYSSRSMTLYKRSVYSMDRGAREMLVRDIRVHVIEPIRHASDETNKKRFKAWVIVADSILRRRFCPEMYGIYLNHE